MTPRQRRLDQGGYVSVFVAGIFVVLCAIAAFCVDVGNWYVTGQEAQRAADAAALAGVPQLPSNQAAAFARAKVLAAANGYDINNARVTVVPSIDGQPTRLRVTVSKRVDNTFGGLLGISSTTITRSAVADYAGPVPMGSPCNEFGNDPDIAGHRGTTCAGVSGQFWASVNSPASAKANGDAYQSTVCASGVDGCTSGVNTDYATDGYFYTVHVPYAVQNLQIQAFDPAFTDVGLLCADNFGSGTTEARDALNDYVTNEATRYVSGTASPFCTGDNTYSGSGTMKTQFTVRSPNAASPWASTSFPIVPGCQKTYNGQRGALFPVLNKASTSTYRDEIAKSFRRWDTVCTIPNAVAGDYLVQVKTNGLTTDTLDQGNRFSLRAWSSTDTTAQNSISVSGREKMAIYSNAPSATTEFYLARVVSGAAGQVLEIKLFDVGDSSQAGTIQLIAPPDSGVTFTNCVASGPTTGTLPNCTFTVQNTTHQGKRVSVQIPIPAAYTCADADQTKCWIRLRYVYGAGQSRQT